MQSVVLAKYLQFSDFELSRLTVLELGSGTGLVGITASVLGAPHVILSDLEYTLNNTRESVKLNRANLKGRVDTVELDWYGNVL
jgi:predicted nicotinamide N-methyase